MTVSRNDIIQIKGLARDDLGIKETFLEYKNNLDEWQRLTLNKEPSKEVMVSHRWDLSALKLASGDEVTFRLVAADLKGNEGMSSSIRLHIVNDGFSPKRFTRLELFKKVFTALNKIVERTEDNRKTYDKKFNSLVHEKDKNKQKLTALQIESELNGLEETLRNKLEQMSAQTALAHKKTDRNDFNLISNVISHLMNSRFSTVLDKLDTQIEDRDQRNHSYHESRGKMHDFHHQVKWAKDLFGRLMAQANSEVFHNDIVQLHHEQKIIETKQLDTDLENIKRRQANLQKTYTTDKTLIISTKETAEHGNHHRLDSLVKQLEEVERDLNEVMIKGPQQSSGMFLAEYFADSKLQIKRLEEKTRYIKLRSSKTPVKGIPEDHWSARFSGTIKAHNTSKTEFTLRTDGDAKIWLDGKLVQDHKRSSKQKDVKFHHTFKAGQEASIKIYYRHYEKSAHLSLQWNNSEKNGRKPIFAAEVMAYDYRKVLSRFKNIERDSFFTKKDITQKGEEARRELRRMLEKHIDPIQEAAKAMRELVDAKKSKDEKKIDKATEKVENTLRQAKEQLADKANLEETKVDADSEFVEDAAKAAEAIANVEKDITTDEKEKAEKLEKIAKAFDKLEKAHELEEKLEKMAKIEQELRENNEAKPQTDFQQTDEKLKEMVVDLQRGDEEDRQTANELNKQIHSHETNDIRNEMNHRKNKDEAKQNVEEQLDELADAVTEAREKQKESVNEARELLNETAPTIGEQLAELAQEAKTQQEKTGELTENVSAENVETNREEAKTLQKDQESLNDKLEDVRQALRRQANAQDLTTEEGRQEARDADDALVMLAQEPPKVEELLAEASNAEDADVQKDALKQAELQQKKISDALETLAEHFDGNQTPQEIAESREQLRAVETNLANTELAQNYEKVEVIAEINEQDLDEQIKTLESILSQDQEMQKALAEIAQETTEQAAEKLAKAASDEQTIESALAEKPKNDKEAERTMKKQAGEQKPVTEITEEASEDLARSQRHQDRLGDEKAAQETQQAQQSAEDAAKKMATAEKKLDSQNNIQQAQQSAQQAQQAAANAAQQAAQTAKSQSEQNTPQTSQVPLSPQQQVSQQLALALNQLDQAKAALAQQKSNQAKATQSPQAKAQQAMQKAQQALAQAQQAQSQSMVQSRTPADPNSTEDPGKSAGIAANEELAIKIKLKNTDEWGKLPKKVARDIRSARKEKVPEQYQHMVNAYFKIIAEQSQNGDEK